MVKNLVAGGAGFIGTNLIKRLLKKNQAVICIDDLSTGSKRNIEKWIDDPNFNFIDHDITKKIDISFDKLWHLACPASPVHYQKNPIRTSKINFIGTLNLLELALKNKASFLFTSSSEIYGQAKMHPQKESYFGNVNTLSKRSCYEEGKRIAESICTDFHREYGLDVKIARIFNAYGPYMAVNDGRVISNFINNALNGKNLLINGDGTQTRSFCFVDDLVDALILLMNSDVNYYPLNIGNDDEITIIDLGKKVIEKINKNLDFDYGILSTDEPINRKPDLSRSKKIINWQPKIGLDEGINKTIEFFIKNKFKS